MAKETKENKENKEKKDIITNMISNEELLIENEKLKKENQKLLAEQEEIILEKESIKIEKENILNELEKQKSKTVLSNSLDKKDYAEAYKTAEILKQDTIKIKIPIDNQNPVDLMVPVTINGYTWTIKRGETVVVPTAVADILENAGYL